MLDGGAGKGATANGRQAQGARIVLTAPLTETIDHAGYFIQMSMASLPMWLEGIINRKYPHWRELEYTDGTFVFASALPEKPPSTFIPLTVSPA